MIDPTSSIPARRASSVRPIASSPRDDPSYPMDERQWVTNIPGLGSAGRALRPSTRRIGATRRPGGDRAVLPCRRRSVGRATQFRTITS
jgi:hypothetical protein